MLEEKLVLSDDFGSSTGPCYMQKCVIMNHVIKWLWYMFENNSDSSETVDVQPCSGPNVTSCHNVLCTLFTLANQGFLWLRRFENRSERHDRVTPTRKEFGPVAWLGAEHV